MSINRFADKPSEGLQENLLEEGLKSSHELPIHQLQALQGKEVLP